MHFTKKLNNALNHSHQEAEILFCGMNGDASVVFLPEVTDESEASAPRPPLVPHTSDVSTSASRVSRHEGKNERSVHHLLDMTPSASALLFALLVFRRSTQQHGAAVGHDEAGHPPGDDSEESG